MKTTGDLELLWTDDTRRRDAIRLGRAGIDYVDVDDGGRTLIVAFFGTPPDAVSHRNFAVEGGVRVRGIRVVSARRRSKAPGEEGVVTLRLDRRGDFSRYTLRVLDVANVDPLYASLGFGFGAPGGAAPIDCARPPAAPPPVLPAPQIDYLAKDYASFRRLLLDRAALVVPAWTERHVPDIGVTLTELLAYAGDHLSYYQDAVATEAYLQTARSRVSVRRHARLVDYAMHEGCNARAWISVETPADVGPIHPRDVTFATVGASGDPAAGEMFEPVGNDALTWYAAHAPIRFYAWGRRGCSIPRGATRATLADAWEPERKGAARERALRHLAAGALLLFEEKLGPLTGKPGDADPAHRHVVRLRHVRRDEDPLYDAPIVEIAWDPADRLPFTLHVNVDDPSDPAAKPLDATLAYGNIVLVDHGRTPEKPEKLDAVPASGASLYRPHLAQPGVTFREPEAGRESAARIAARDPHAAVAQIRELRTVDADGRERAWRVQPDLLASGANDADVVVEVENDGRAMLRFGDGVNGRMPAPGSAVTARYRVGNGIAGNVGAETIVRLAFVRNPVVVGGLTVRNPLPAFGGTAAQSIEEVKALAPSAFRAEPARALTTGDYVRLAQRDPRVERAAATFRWTGSRKAVRVAVQPVGTDAVDDALLAATATALEPYRAIGHDVEVVATTYVPLFVALTVTVADGYRRVHVEAALRGALGNGVAAGGMRGLFHPDELAFGAGMTQSSIVARVVAVPGVRTVAVDRFERLFAPSPGVVPAKLTVGPLEIVRLDNDPDRVENGVLALTLVGGR